MGNFSQGVEDINEEEFQTRLSAEKSKTGNERWRFIPPFFLSHLCWELANALHQILVGLPVSSNQLPHHWNHLEAVGIVEPGKSGKETQGQQRVSTSHWT